MPGVDIAEVMNQVGAPQQGLVSVAQLRAAGVSRSQVSRAVAAGLLTRVRPRTYALAPLEAQPRFVVTEQGVAPGYVTHVRAALLSLGPTAAACCRTAAALYGWEMLVEPARTVEVAVPHGRAHICAPGVAVVRRRSAAHLAWTPDEATSPLWLTSPTQTVIDCALTLPTLDAVVLCDSALRAKMVTLEELELAAGRLSGVRDAAKVRQVLAACDPLSGSVLESALRWRFLQAGLVFQTQHVISSGGRHVLRADFCFPEARLVVEVDGRRWHLDRAKDRRTDNDLAVLGYRVLRYGSSEVLQEWRAVVADVRTALLVDPATESTHLAPDAAEPAA